MNIIQELKQEEDRVIRAYEIYKANQIEKLDDKTFLVKNKYIVQDILDELYTCTCQDFTNRCGYKTIDNEFMNCKHCISVMLYLLNDGA